MTTKRVVKSVLFTFIFGLIVYYFMLPAINLSSPEFYVFLFLLVACFCLVFALPSRDMFRNKNIPLDILKLFKYVGISFGGIVLLILLINVVLSPLFDSKDYASRITINEDSEFVKDVNQVEFSKIPLLDKDSSQKLGDRVMGQLTDLVSQFYVSDLYTQINYQDKIERVTPLEYNGFIKYLTNRNDGVAGYITVNSVTGESNLVKLDKGMKYVDSAYFFENLNRKLRFSYPTEVFGQITFETDNEGNPYWVVPTIKYAGVGLRPDANGVILLNAIDGSSKKYNVSEVPTWVDHVYSADLIISQVDDWGTYRNGFLNSIFGQKNVVATTSGYNYMTLDDDVYLYTGITSVLSDESNIGFILTNMRTKETNFYSVAGAEEYSAMASAEGQVQQMNYDATFPLLINLNNKPTYLISLKDNAGLVKMYAFVDVVDYQKVTVTDVTSGIEVAAKNYLANVSSNAGETLTKDITVKMITSSTISGNTYYYITDTDNVRYRVSISKDEYNLPFVVSGSKLNITYVDSKGVIDIISINN